MSKASIDERGKTQAAEESVRLVELRRGRAELAHALGFDDRFHQSHVFLDAGADDEVLKILPLRDFETGVFETAFKVFW